MAIDRKIKISIPGLGDDVIFVQMQGADALSRPFHFVVDFVSTSADLKAQDVLGTGLTIEVTGEPPRFFNGLVSDFLLTDVRSDFSHYRVTVVPWLWFLTLHTDNRIFQKKTVIDIVEAVCKPYPKAKIEKRLQKSYPPREYCVQYGESDLDFVQRLLQHEGIFYFFEYEDGVHTLVLCDANSLFKPSVGAEKVAFNADISLTTRYGNHITEWLPRTAVRPGKYAQTDYDFEKPSSDLMSRTENPLGHSADGNENYHYPGNYVDHGRGDKLSGLRLQELQSTHIQIEAKGTAIQLWSGCTFGFEAFPREAENMDYVVLKADYSLWDERYRSESGQGEQGYGVRLTLAPERIPHRPLRITLRPVMRGPQTATVVGPAGEEIYTDKYARVKVQFHWDRQGKKDENTTCFVRVSQTWAGSGWGFIQIPRIGQEVIVDFLEGDPDQPIITGRVYNAEQMPPYGLPGSATQSGWKSNSSPGGGGWNELRFEDKAGSEEVYFQAQKDHNELVKHNEARTIGNDFSEDVGHDAQQGIGHNRTETVGNDKAVSVGNDRKVLIGNNDTETVGHDRKLFVKNDEAIDVSGSSDEKIWKDHSQYVLLLQKITVGGARLDKVGGAETRQVGAWHSTTVVGYRSITVGGYQKRGVAGSDGTNVQGEQTIEVGKNQTTTVKGDQSFWVDGDGTYMVKGPCFWASEDSGTFKAAKHTLIEAGEQLTLKCGSAALVMTKDGTITIEGKDITINGSGKINIKASGEVTVKGSKINNN